MKKTANTWEHKVGINAIIANFVCEKVDSHALLILVNTTYHMTELRGRALN